MRLKKAAVHKSRILFLDIETAPNVAFVWGLFDQNISHNQVKTSSYVLCWAAKWEGRSAMQFDSIHRSSKRQMLKRIHTLLNEADIVVHYNGNKFDTPTLNKEFVKADMLPPAPFKQVDMLRVCRQVFRFESNKLDSITQSLAIGRKVKHHGFELWVDCMNGNDKAWAIMERYNKQDVTLLEKVYHRLLPWIAQHPLLRLCLNQLACPKCGSKRTQRRGCVATRAASFYRFQCLHCGGWFRSSKKVHTFKGEQGINI